MEEKALAVLADLMEWSRLLSGSMGCLGRSTRREDQR